MTQPDTLLMPPGVFAEMQKLTREELAAHRVRPTKFLRALAGLPKPPRKRRSTRGPRLPADGKYFDLKATCAEGQALAREHATRAMNKMVERRMKEVALAKWAAWLESQGIAK